MYIINLNKFINVLQNIGKIQIKNSQLLIIFAFLAAIFGFAWWQKGKPFDKNR
ncbi:hypothetical protein HPDP_00426 [Candidatus Hepatincola sp. Pdp]